MKIKVYPGPFCDSSILDEDGCVEMAAGAVMADLLAMLKCPVPMRWLKLYMVNYQKAGPDTPLKEGDIVSIIAPIAGG